MTAPLVSTREAAQILGVTEETVCLWFNEGSLPEAVPPGRNKGELTPRLFRRADIEGFSRTRKPRTLRGLDLTDLADGRFRARFWSKVDKNGPIPAHCPELGPCWIWTRATKQGYGQFTVSRGWFATAHMVSYALEVGPVPPGAHTCHRCDNPPCVNPGHLFIGSAADNSSDMFAKGREGDRHPGSQRHNARLTEEDVRAIRSVPHYYGRNSALARQYGVSTTTIRKITDGQKWRHVA